MVNLSSSVKRWFGSLVLMMLIGITLQGVPSTTYAIVEIPHVTPTEDDYKLIKPEAPGIPLIFVDPAPDQASGVLKLRKLVTQISAWILSILVSLGIIMLVVSGYMFIIAGGNEEKLTKAKKTVQWTVIGLVIALFAWTLIANISSRWPAGPRDEFSDEPGSEDTP